MIDRKKIEELLSKVKKPGRYLGNEWNAVRKDLNNVAIRFALAFPDLYEIGMSHLGYKLIYHLLNEIEDVACERVFSPDVDLEALLREENIPLFTLESKEDIARFDIIGFSLAYELNYTNILNILELGSLPLKTNDRTQDHPLVIAGGPSCLNPEPLADFIDIFIIGEAEEALPEALDIFKEVKSRSDYRKIDILKRLAKVKGIYVPSLYKVDYGEGLAIKGFEPLYEEASSIITKRTVDDLENSFYPTRQIVPYIGIIHDRVSIEIMRGCPNLCRFCQARQFYHHKRERSLEKIVALAQEAIAKTGYEELSLLSLSSGDHSEIAEILSILIDNFEHKGISVSLPSLHIDKLLEALPALLSRIKKSGLTFAPEAGSKRLLNVINKRIDIDELFSAIDAAYRYGWNRVKLYFMIGLPSETYDDIDGIIGIIRNISALHNKRININVSISSFIPKPHTPFQREPMASEEELRAKIIYIRERIRPRRVRLRFQDIRLTMLEGILSRGDRRLGSVIMKAHKKGCRFDSWLEHLNFDAWMDAFCEEGLDPNLYLYKKKALKERMPWEHIYCGISTKS